MNFLKSVLLIFILTTLAPNLAFGDTIFRKNTHRFKPYGQGQGQGLGQHVGTYAKVNPRTVPPPPPRHSWWDIVDGMTNRLEKPKPSPEEQKQAQWLVAKKLQEQRAAEDQKEAKLAADIKKLQAKIKKDELAKGKKDDKGLKSNGMLKLNKVDSMWEGQQKKYNFQQNTRRRRQGVRVKGRQYQRPVNRYPVNTNQYRNYNQDGDRRLVYQNYV